MVAAIGLAGARMSHPPEKEARSFLVLVRVNGEGGIRRLRGFLFCGRDVRAPAILQE